ncbi:hypothetical protein IPV09_07410 [Tessaracoccus sp. SD287]|uniref:hypothetical protein n=1 Tax=Tessaracoccus sp. SD287 TaxID=2782008 RepID=UPI001A97A167|nr:hypothetical protein [Tessaracoccus sp. SD287]MBO1031162.1 hypothetical protein [Tessaracoccus sp. SD287]
MAKIPGELRREIIAELYRRLDALKWEERAQSERSAIYHRLVDDPVIGGRLAPHLPVDRIRLWIKDGPAKEYRRALEGVGPYAGFTTRRAAGAEGVVQAVLGKDWTVVDGSVGEKPMRCAAEQGDSRRLLVWGPESSLKELFWHAAMHVAEHGDYDTPLIVVTRRGNAPIDSGLWRRATRLAQLIRCEAMQASLDVTPKPDEE